MACFTCNKPQSTCGCSKKSPVIPCKCPNGRHSAECVEYRGCPLTPLGVIPGNNLDEILNILNKIVADTYLRLEDDFSGTNIGRGVKVYKGKGTKGAHEFRTLHVGDGLLISQKSDSIEISANSEWLEEYLSNFINDDAFVNKLKELLREQWFVDLIKKLTHQPWFTETIRYQLNKDWFTTFLNNLLRQEWFEDLMKEIMREQWFVDIFQETLNHVVVKGFMVRYIKDLFDSGLIDICKLVEVCDLKPTPTPVPPTPTDPPKPVNKPPRISSDVTFRVANRMIDFPVVGSEITNRYSDPENDPMVSIRITGGDLTNLKKVNGTPLRVGDVITLGELNSIRFSAADTDNGYTQVVEYVAVNNIGQESN